MGLCWSVWHWVCQTWGKFLAASHTSHQPCSPLPPAKRGNANQYTGVDIKSQVKHFGRLVCVVMCKNKKGGKNQNWYFCKTASPDLACGCPHFRHSAPHLWLVPSVSGSAAGQISLLLLSVLCWKGFTLEEGGFGASFLWADLLTLQSPTASWPCWCCLRRGTCPAYATGSCGGFCCPERPSVFETTTVLMFPCNSFFLVFHDDEGEKELPGGLVGRRDFPALPLGAFEHLNPGVAPLFWWSLKWWGGTPRAADTKACMGLSGRSRKALSVCGASEQ